MEDKTKKNERKKKRNNKTVNREKTRTQTERIPRKRVRIQRRNQETGRIMKRRDEKSAEYVNEKARNRGSDEREEEIITDVKDNGNEGREKRNEEAQ